MKKFVNIIPVVLFILVAAPQVFAQIDGCEDSPENPTVILGLIVSAAGFGYMHLRNRFGNRKK
jgi:XrtJ-associated TM-motif-TM protein